MMDFKDMINIRAELISYRVYGKAFKDLDGDRREIIYALAEKDAYQKMLKLTEEEQNGNDNM